MVDLTGGFDEDREFVFATQPDARCTWDDESAIGMIERSMPLSEVDH